VLPFTSRRHEELRRVTPESLHVAIVLTPFLALPLAGWAGTRGSRPSMALALIPAALTAYFAWALALVAAAGPFTVTVPWAPGLGLALSFRLDGLGTVFALIVAGVGTLIVAYAASYLDGRPHTGKFQVFLFAFMGSMLGLVLTDNVIALYLFWELTGFTSYFLIGFEHERAAARRAALQALIVTAAGGLSLLAAGVLLMQIGGTPSLSGLVAGQTRLTDHPLYVGLALLVLMAAFTKSAQVPFHFWLPNAMEAPTPVSAYLHSATMVTAGVYLVARMTPLLGGSALWTITTVSVGTVTVLVGGFRAVLETDLKRILAYATVSALGVMMLLMGIGSRAAITAGLVYLLAHAAYKGALFMVAGAVDHETGTRDVTELGGLRAGMPWTARAAVLAALSMAGIPLFLGFIGKEVFYDTVAHTGPLVPWSGLLLAAAVAGSALMGGAGFGAGIAPFVGRTSHPDAHEPPFAMWLGPAVLAALGIVLGVMPGWLDAPIGLAVAAAVSSPASVHLAVWHGVTAVFALSVLTIAIALALYGYRASIRRTTWPEALDAERLYSGTLGMLDTISRAIAPALQSGSLRSYLLVVVATAVTLVAVGLATERVLPAPRLWTPIRLYEALIAVLMCAAALAATQARTVIGAVLTLGIVGYGVALTFALFGAPDLAMTQFAVETLTVVIFVLVFRHLHGFGDLSSRLVRGRDAVVALAAGAVITALVLIIASSGTTSRLSGFFAEASPTLAHGRNIVNVMLVDFRGFDTMGEITVLVTVAIGVRALLSIRTERRS
jgi:multicomponent Na+:H+ antiporter subunit A